MSRCWCQVGCDNACNEELKARGGYSNEDIVEAIERCNVAGRVGAGKKL